MTTLSKVLTYPAKCIIWILCQVHLGSSVAVTTLWTLAYDYLMVTAMCLAPLCV